MNEYCSQCGKPMLSHSGSMGMCDNCRHTIVFKTNSVETNPTVKELQEQVKKLEAEIEKLKGLLEIQNTQLSEPVLKTYSRSASFNKKNSIG